MKWKCHSEVATLLSATVCSVSQLGGEVRTVMLNPKLCPHGEVCQVLLCLPQFSSFSLTCCCCSLSFPLSMGSGSPCPMLGGVEGGNRVKKPSFSLSLGAGRGGLLGGETNPVGRQLCPGLQHLRPCQLQHPAPQNPVHQGSQGDAESGEGAHRHCGQQTGPAPPTGGVQRGGSAPGPLFRLWFLRGFCS